MTEIKNIPNNEEGRQFIKSLRKFLKGTPKTIKVRGRGHRHGIRRYRQDLPLDKAERFTVYFESRPTHVYKKVTKTVVETQTVQVPVTKTVWERVPTKWATTV